MMATNQEPMFGEKQPLEFSLPPRPHAEDHARKPAPAGSSSGKGLGTLLTACVLALLFGAAGAWGYIKYLEPLSKTPQEKTPRLVSGAAAAPDQTPVLARLDDLTGKVDQLRSRLDQLPKPVTQPDLEPLKQQLTALGNLPGKVEALDKRVDVLPTKIDEHGRKITTMMADIDGVRKQVSSLQTDLGTRGVKVDQSSLKSDDRVAETSHETPREIEAPRSGSLKPGVDLFRQKKYDQASEYFSGLTKADPSDARVWYFAALARGLATREWTGQTEQLVSQGVDREKAGKPEKKEIDSAFSDLKPETGKDWLAFYRQKAR
jgi:hypothetical protein